LGPSKSETLSPNYLGKESITNNMTITLKKIDEYRWEVPKTGNMRVPGKIFATESMLRGADQQEPLKQVANVATLPGILTASLAMPDIHWGYGFPIGGVAAFDWNSGIISPGGVGYDINCGVRLATTSLEEKDARPKLESLVTALYQNIPAGIGSTGSVKLSTSEEKKVLKEGSRWTGRASLAEEMPDAYKDVSEVVGVVHGAGISRKVAKLRPIAVVKG